MYCSLSTFLPIFAIKNWSAFNAIYSYDNGVDQEEFAVAYNGKTSLINDETLGRSHWPVGERKQGGYFGNIMKP